MPALPTQTCSHQVVSITMESKTHDGKQSHSLVTLTLSFQISVPDLGYLSGPADDITHKQITAAV